MAKQFKCKNCEERFDTERIVMWWLNRYCSKFCRLDNVRKAVRRGKEKAKKAKVNKRESISMLTKKLDKIFSEYIRRKYSNEEWIITCISCDKELPWKESHNCHWIGRGNKQYRFDEDNCRPWCVWCNTFNQEFHQRIFTIRQIERLGKDIVDLMIDNTNYVYKQGKTELRALIEEYTVKLNQLK